MMIRVTELEIKSPTEHKGTHWGPIVDGHSWLNTEAISRVRAFPEGKGTEITWHCGSACISMICQEPPEYFLSFLPGASKP